MSYDELNTLRKQDYKEWVRVTTEIAYGQRDAQWAKTRAKAHEAWLNSRRQRAA